MAGGVHSREDVARATREDAVVAAHYDGLSQDSLRPMVTGVDRMAYVSYRIGHRVFWTKRPVRIPRGELILTDGTDTIRARCGNRMSDTPREPVLDVEPAAGEIDEVVGGPSVASGPATLGSDMSVGAGAMPSATTSTTVPRVPFLEAVTTALARSPGLIAAVDELVGITPSATLVVVPVVDFRPSSSASPPVPAEPRSLVGGWADPGWPPPSETRDPSPVAGVPGGETSPGAPTGGDSSPGHESGSTGSVQGSGPDPSAGGPGFAPGGSDSPTGAGGAGGSTAGPGGGPSAGGQPASGGSIGSGSNGSGSNGSSGSGTGAGTGSAPAGPGTGSGGGSGSESGSGTSNGSSGGGATGGYGGGPGWPSDAPTAPSVPEPSTWLLFGVGVGVTALRVARTRNRR